MMRSRTAQAKKDDRVARNRRTDDSASPCRVKVMSARETSRFVTAPICIEDNDFGSRRGSAQSATYVFAATATLRSSSHVGITVRTVVRPARGSMPPASAALSRVSHA